MKYDVDFRITQVGSFVNIAALSQAAREAPGRLLSQAEVLVISTERPVWRAFPEAVAPILEGLRKAGYRLEFL